MKIKIDKKKCSGCHLCEMACSILHLGVINTEKSAIRVKKDDLNTSLSQPVLCRQCKQMTCIGGEQVKASAERKKFIWDKSRAERCPFNALPSSGQIAYHCDLCGGKPQCVRVCTTGAIAL